MSSSGQSTEDENAENPTLQGTLSASKAIVIMYRL